MESGEYKMVHIKRENECDTFNEVFDRSGVKYEPCLSGKYDGSGGDYEGHSDAYSKYEEHEEEKYVAVTLNTDVDFTDVSTIQCKTEQIKSEFDYDIQYGDVKIELVESIPENCELYCGKEVFQCKICSKAFTQSVDLRRHEMIDKGGKPIQCKICSKTFARSSCLKVHERIHTGERPYHCKFCSKAFTQSGDLRRHEMIHKGEKPVQCKICSKTFARSSSLKRHERIHTGERPYDCKFCSKAFTQLSHLKIHERNHTGEKPFHCQFCSKAFSQSSSLKKHGRIHTGQN